MHHQAHTQDDAANVHSLLQRLLRFVLLAGLNKCLLASQVAAACIPLPGRPLHHAYRACR